eukprot:jgi/Chlat1/3644/Chrsp238S03647
MATHAAISLSEDNQEEEEESTLQHKDSALTPAPRYPGGAPTTMIWTHFTEMEGMGNRNRRPGAKCNYCGKQYKDTRVEAMERHTIEECRSVTQPVRSATLGALVAKRGRAASQSANVVGGRRKRRVEQSSITAHYESGSLGKGLCDELDAKSLIFFVMCGIPYYVANSKYFTDLHQFTERMKGEINATITLDGLTNVNNQSVYGCMVITIERVAHLLTTFNQSLRMLVLVACST